MGRIQELMLVQVICVIRLGFRNQIPDPRLWLCFAAFHKFLSLEFWYQCQYLIVILKKHCFVKKKLVYFSEAGLQSLPMNIIAELLLSRIQNMKGMVDNELVYHHFCPYHNSRRSNSLRPFFVYFHPVPYAEPAKTTQITNAS